MTGEPDPRRDPPTDAGELETLGAFLDWYRETVVLKVSGLDLEAATQHLVPSPATTLLGIVKHLTDVERWWFRAVFAGEDVEAGWSADDPDAEFRIEPGDTVESVVTGYRDQAARSRQVVARAALDERARRHRTDRTLRWILVHMIEETARHAGHMDILRELTDGAVGD